MHPDNQQHDDIKQLLQENQRLLIENNTILRKMRRTAILSSILRFLWFVIMLGSLFYVYYYYIEPNLNSIKERVSSIEAVLPDGATIKGFYDEFKAKGTTN